MSAMAGTAGRSKGMSKDEKFVIFASSLGTIFEWYDFYLYAVLAPFFAALFFPAGNDTAALLSAFATYAAGFLVRPFGAVIFGRIGDLVGRKYTFLVTIMVMGSATFLVGVLPTYAAVGWLAPILLVTLRLCQGLALGGEYGGAATYVAEHARPHERGYATSWIQTTATLGLLLALIIIAACREWMDAKVFAEWGWRIPFLISIILLVFSVYIRLRLNETPIFQKMVQEGKGSKAPLTESFFHYPNNKYVLLALLGATAGQGVVWYTGQFYALFFLILILKMNYVAAYLMIGISLIIGTPFFIVFGWLSDRIGRLKIILAGCAIAAITYFPLFAGLTHYINPDLEAFHAKNQISVSADPATCHFQHLRRALVEVLELRSGQGLRQQARVVVQDDRHARSGRQGRPDDQLDQGRGLRRSKVERRVHRRQRSQVGRSGQDQLVHGRIDPHHHGDLRDHGVRADRGLPGRDVPDQDPLHLDVAALPHRQRLVRRDAAADRDRIGRSLLATSITASGTRSLSR